MNAQAEGSSSGAAGVLLGGQEVQSKVILVDFSVTLDGLEEQLLGPRRALPAACWAARAGLSRSLQPHRQRPKGRRRHGGEGTLR